MVFKWKETIPDDSLWISKLGINNQKLTNLKVVLATHDTTLFNNQTAKRNRLFIKFLRENIQFTHKKGSENDSNEILRTKNQKEEIEEAKDQDGNKDDDLSVDSHENDESDEYAENEVIADVYMRIFAKFQVNSMDSLLDLWKEQISHVKKITNMKSPGRHYLLEFLSHNSTLSKISQMTIVLNLTLSQFFSAIVNSKNFINIQLFYDPDYTKPKGWFNMMLKSKKKSSEKYTNFDTNFEEACILSYVYSVLKNISLDKKRTQEIIITKRNLRKAWFQLIGKDIYLINEKLF
jgi:hypothetical protein